MGVQTRPLRKESTRQVVASLLIEMSMHAGIATLLAVLVLVLAVSPSGVGAVCCRTMTNECVANISVASECVGHMEVFQSGSDCAACERGACCEPNARCSLQTRDTCGSPNLFLEATTCEEGYCPWVLTKYIDELPIPPVAQPVWDNHYRISLVETKVSVHSELPDTTMWTYDGMFPGPTILAETNVPITVEFVNALAFPNGTLREKHFWDMQTACVHGPNMWGGAARTVVHVHGSHTSQDSDGHSDFTVHPGQSQVFRYENEQAGATLWYHDHALGITRLNVQMGLAGFFLIRNPEQDSLGLPSGEFDVPLMFADRSFKRNGELYYEDPLPQHTFGRQMLVNGKAWPRMTVKRAAYRFRLLDASNHRELDLSFVRTDTNTPLTFQLIGGDHGLIGSPRSLMHLPIVPSERWEIVLDFSDLPAGTEVVVRNSAAVMMMRMELTGTVPVQMMNRMRMVDMPELMKFVVSAEVGEAASVPSILVPDYASLLPSADDEVRERQFELFLLHNDGVVNGGVIQGGMTMEEMMRMNMSDPAHVLMMRLGIGQTFPTACQTNPWLISNLKWDDLLDFPVAGTTERWTFNNPSDHMHPMHIHLVPGVAVDRANFSGVASSATIGSAFELYPWEQGVLKDVWEVPPFSRLSVMVKFWGDFRGRFPFHCHLLEHEDMEMMRQYRLINPVSLCNNDGECGADEDCHSCPNDCASVNGARCGNSLCEVADGEDCVNCPQDCLGSPSSSPSSFCCGRDTMCNDARCIGHGRGCRHNVSLPACCGDAMCEGAETADSCAIDCADSKHLPPSLVLREQVDADGALCEFSHRQGVDAELTFGSDDPTMLTRLMARWAADNNVPFGRLKVLSRTPNADGTSLVTIRVGVPLRAECETSTDEMSESQRLSDSLSAMLIASSAAAHVAVRLSVLLLALLLSVLVW